MLKIISSLEKCFLDESITTKATLKNASMLKNEIFRFEACYVLNRTPKESESNKRIVKLDIESPLADYIRVWRVDHVPVKVAAESHRFNGDYLRMTPGLYPDLLTPLRDDRRLMVYKNLESLYFEINTKGQVAPGEYPVTLNFICEATGEKAESATLTVNIINAELPEQDITVTQWFYCDCLQTHYDTESFDERHWAIIEKFIKTAVEHGINMILTPLFTPPLDTFRGNERPTTQLVDVIVENGEFRFGFDKLSRWVDLCNKLGVKYFEIAHFFTQWGARSAPKIMATVDGEYTRIFGWETDSTGPEYAKFLHAFIPQLLDFMKSKDGADKRCWFHISDEPSLEHIERYKACRAVVADLLKGYPIIDALSNYEFYEQGIVDHPIPATTRVETFVEHKVPDLWCYYCIGQWDMVSNRFISMAGSRTRIIGTQFYKYDIAGFLQWGYNFYYNQGSYGAVNPFISTDGECFAPSGDTFSVYPGPRGEALPSLRLKLFHDALQDLAAFKLCESLYSKEFVLNLMEEGEMPITFFDFPRDNVYLVSLREKVNAAIAAKI